MMADLSASGVGRYRYTQAKSTPMNDEMQSARATMHCTLFFADSRVGVEGEGERSFQKIMFESMISRFEVLHPPWILFIYLILRL